MSCKTDEESRGGKGWKQAMQLDFYENVKIFLIAFCERARKTGDFECYCRGEAVSITNNRPPLFSLGLFQLHYGVVYCVNQLWWEALEKCNVFFWKSILLCSHFCSFFVFSESLQVAFDRIKTRGSKLSKENTSWTKLSRLTLKSLHLTFVKTRLDFSWADLFPCMFSSSFLRLVVITTRVFRTSPEVTVFQRHR